MSKKEDTDRLEERIHELEKKLIEKERDCREANEKRSRVEHQNEQLRYRSNRLERLQSRLSKSQLAIYEMRLNALMRGLVVITFSIVGPMLLIVYVFNISVDPLLLDIFKIWLGAAIGISTNLLQKTERIETPTATEETVSSEKPTQPSQESSTQ